MTFSDRIRCVALKDKIMSAEQAATNIKDGMVVATSGFTPSGYPKAVPLALAKRVENGEAIQIDLISGASVGDELDGALARAGAIRKRFAYQTNHSLREAINHGQVLFQDMHLSHVPRAIANGDYGHIDLALIEAIAINEDGSIVPSTSVGLSLDAIQCADAVIIEINTSQPMGLEGVHDIYSVKNGMPIPITKTDDRIGDTAITCDINKIIGIVACDIVDDVRPLGEINEDARAISNHLINFFEQQVALGKLPKNLLPLQSGVGAVANAVFAGLLNSSFTDLSCYTEVIQDAMLNLIDAGKIKSVSGTSFTPSASGLVQLKNNIDRYAKYCILRPMGVSNHPEVIRRLGVIAINTAIECDIYGHVNSSNIMGSRMMNGLGGSGDFARNAHLSIFTTVSTAKDGKISSIVPMVSHVDHTEHDVHIIVTEQGLADLRGLAPKERAECIIENCAHPKYKTALLDYFTRAKNGKYAHEPHILSESLSWHSKFLKTGSM